MIRNTQHYVQLLPKRGKKTETWQNRHSKTDIQSATKYLWYKKYVMIIITTMRLLTQEVRDK